MVKSNLLKVALSRGTGIVLSYVFTFYAALLLDSNVASAVLWSQAFVILVGGVGRFGLDYLILRYIYDNSKNKGVCFLAVITPIPLIFLCTVFVSCLSFDVIGVTAFNLVQLGVIAALYIYLYFLSIVLQKNEYTSTFFLLQTPFLCLSYIVGMLFYSNLDSILMLNIYTYACVLLIILFLPFKKCAGFDFKIAKSLVFESAGNWGAQVLGLLQTYGAVFVCGFLFEPKTVVDFSIGQKIAMFIPLIGVVFNSIYAPKFTVSDLDSKKLYESVNRLGFKCSLTCSILLIIVFGLLLFFDVFYNDLVVIFALCLLSQLVSAYVICADAYLCAVGKPYLYLKALTYSTAFASIVACCIYFVFNFFDVYVFCIVLVFLKLAYSFVIKRELKCL